MAATYYIDPNDFADPLLPAKIIKIDDGTDECCYDRKDPSGRCDRSSSTKSDEYLWDSIPDLPGGFVITETLDPDCTACVG